MDARWPFCLVFTTREHSFFREVWRGVKNQIKVVLDESVPRALVAVLERVPGIAVQREAEAPYVQHGSQRRAIRLLTRPVGVGSPEAAADELLRLAHMDGEEVIPLVFASSLPRPLRAALEERGVSYADARGDAHLVAPGLFVHIDTNPVSRPSRDNAGAAGIGVVGIRAVQVLAQNPERNWSVAELAEAAGVSTGHAHNVLRTMQVADLIETQGLGPSKRRRVRDHRALLDWLAAQPRRRVSALLACSLYARTPQDLARGASRSLDAAGLPHAFTGGLAASFLGAGPTAVPRATLRVDPDVPLMRAAQALDAEVTERGANLMLWSDTGRVGTHGREQHDGAWLAPPVRIYLDLLGERRGADAAAHFRELVLKA